MASELMTVASIPMWSAETRSISFAWVTPRKKLPPPTTIPPSTPGSRTPAISPAISCTRPPSTPKPRPAASASPESFKTTRLYILFEYRMGLEWDKVRDEFHHCMVDHQLSKHSVSQNQPYAK